MSFFKTKSQQKLVETKTCRNKNLSKQKLVETVHGGVKKPRKLKIQKQSEDNIIRNTRNLFKLKKKKKAIKDKIFRDIKTLFEQQKEDYYKPVRVGNF